MVPSDACGVAEPSVSHIKIDVKEDLQVTKNIKIKTIVIIQSFKLI